MTVGARGNAGRVFSGGGGRKWGGGEGAMKRNPLTIDGRIRLALVWSALAYRIRGGAWLDDGARRRV